MYDPAVPLSRLATVAAWATTFTFIAAAWVAFALAFDDLAGLLGLTGCAMSAVAATLTIRCFAVRLSRLVRATAGLPSADRPRSLHSVAD